MSTWLARAASSGRVVVLMAIAALLIGPMLTDRGSAGVVNAATTARWASCPGVAFYPLFSDSYEPNSKYATNLTTGRFGQGVLTCALTLPAGATVTGAKFHLYDVSATYNVGPCNVNRVKLDPPTGAIQSLAGPVSTSGSSGYVTRADTSIAHATVSNRYYAYYASCSLPSLTSDLGIIGVSVRYVP